MSDLTDAVRFLLTAAMASPWLLALLFAVALIDAVLPVVPSEAVVITAGMSAAAGDQHLLLVIATAMAGSLLGESACYCLGRGFEPALRGWVARTNARRTAYARVGRALASRGGLILLTVRYVPGARTVATLTAGATAYSFRRFFGFTVLGVGIASTYVALLGYLGGGAFADDAVKALGFSLGLALAIGLTAELVRRVGARLHR